MRDSLRMITNDAAGIAASEPMSRCVADHGMLLGPIMLEREGILTNIAPNRSFVLSIVGPDNRIYNHFQAR